MTPSLVSRGGDVAGVRRSILTLLPLLPKGLKSAARADRMK